MSAATADPGQRESWVPMIAAQGLIGASAAVIVPALAALTILPAGRLPGYRPAEIPVNPLEPSAEEERRIALAYEAREAAP